MTSQEITVHVVGLINGTRVMLVGAHVQELPGQNIQAANRTPPRPRKHPTGAHGNVHFPVANTTQHIVAEFLGKFRSRDIADWTQPEFEIALDLDGMNLEASIDSAGWVPVTPDLQLVQNKPVALRISWPPADDKENLRAYFAHGDNQQEIAASARLAKQPNPSDELSRKYTFTPTQSGSLPLHAALTADKVDPLFQPGKEALVANVAPDPMQAPLVNVALRRTGSRMTEDVPLWVEIRKGTNALSFDRYLDFMEWLFCSGKNPRHIKGDFSKIDRRALPFTDTDSYRNVKVATEAFVMANCSIFGGFDKADALYVEEQLSVDASSPMLAGLFKTYRDDPQSPHTLAYLAMVRRKLLDEGIKDVDIGDVNISPDGRFSPHASTCYGVLKRRLEHPCFLELIWSYWQEEGMLNQTMNAISRRFQNVRGPLANDPLANVEIDPLRPLNNVLWGYVQDEQHRLSVVRRNYEYDHHYGVRLVGKAVNDMRSADSRSRFLEAFHTLLSIVSAFYKRDDDTTMVADGFPVLNALKEAHLILSQGAHNQFGDLPSTARIEMLMQQWILARPEFREFLPTRIMVAYPEPWMDRVDAMKKLQGWSDTSVLHFRNLAIFGEQILLSIRYGAWAGVNDPWQAVNWARYWRPEVQGYTHAYRSVTSVDLSVDVTNARIDAVMPSVHLVKRLAEQKVRIA